MNQEMAIAIPTVANVVPFNDQVNGSNVDFTSDMSVDSNNSTPVDFVVTLPEFESNGIAPNLRVSDTVYGPREDPSTRRIVRLIWPCILASPDINVAMGRGAIVYAPSSIPLAICTKHGNVGILKLEEVALTEEYTRIIHHYPEPKVVHMYNQCVLIFPPNELNYFYEKNGQLSPPLKLNNNGDSNTPDFKDEFLKICMKCDKSLEGEDIYIYRVDSSFDSEECREQEIEADKQKELTKAAAKKSYSKTAITDKRIFCNLGIVYPSYLVCLIFLLIVVLASMHPSFLLLVCNLGRQL